MLMQLLLLEVIVVDTSPELVAGVAELPLVVAPQLALSIQSK
mgnify:CR=1 FL=1